MKGKHKTEMRERSIAEQFCVQSGCRFKGKRAQQGVCHSSEPEIIDIKKFLAQEADIIKELRDTKRTHYKDNPRGWIRWLEAMNISAMLNWSSSMDELIRLRAENSILHDKLTGLCLK